MCVCVCIHTNRRSVVIPDEIKTPKFHHEIMDKIYGSKKFRQNKS